MQFSIKFDSGKIIMNVQLETELVFFFMKHLFDIFHIIGEKRIIEIIFRMLFLREKQLYIILKVTILYLY